MILFDPIFQGLAISLISGEVASLLLSRMAVPIIYYIWMKHAPESAGTVSAGSSESATFERDRFLAERFRQLFCTCFCIALILGLKADRNSCLWFRETVGKGDYGEPK